MEATKTCPRCQQPIVVLLYSAECTCVAIPEPAPITDPCGFVILASTAQLPQPQFVFASQQGAEDWRNGRGLPPTMKIWEVRSAGFVFVTWVGGEIATKKPWLVHQWRSQASSANHAWLS